MLLSVSNYPLSCENRNKKIFPLPFASLRVCLTIARGGTVKEEVG